MSKRNFVIVIAIICSAIGKAEGVESFKGVWSWRVVAKNDETRLWEQRFNFVQHGNVVCGEWSRDTPRQRWSGYIAGSINEGVLVAYSCNDDGQPTQHLCPKFEQNKMVFQKVKQTIRWSDETFQKGSKETLVRRSKNPANFNGDENTSPMLLACLQGSNIPMHRTAIGGR